MSDAKPNNPLERYLDGLLSEADTQRVERALPANPKAQEQVRLQHRVDDSLRRLFGPGEITVDLRPRRSAGVRVWAAGLAAALLLAVGVWAMLLRGNAAPASPLAGIYDAEVKAGFVPKEVCTTRDQFVEWVRTYYTQSLYPKAEHKGVEFVGWSYAPAISKKSGVLLAKADGQNIIVVMDRKHLEKAPWSGSGDPCLHTFREQFGSLVLYEVSPLDHASVLPILSTTDRP